MIATILLAISVAMVVVGSGALTVRTVRRHASAEAATQAEVADWLHELLDAVPGAHGPFPERTVARSESLEREDAAVATAR